VLPRVDELFWPTRRGACFDEHCLVAHRAG
jgi:hypothetical protein